MTEKTWDLTAWVVVAAAAILSLAQWPSYPYFLDSYYHLAVIQGFREAGGPVLRDFWEAAPAGRPHLYPPLFHLLWLPASLAGAPPLLLSKIWSAAIFPLLLAVSWAALRGAGASSRLACLAVVLLATPFTLFLSAVNYLPATLALLAGLGMLPALAKKRWLACGLLLGLAFWLHAGIPWLLLFSLVLFGLAEPPFRRTVWRAAGLGLLVASPWLLHLALHLTAVRLSPRPEERYLDLSVLILLLALAGMKPAWERKTPLGRFFAALFAGFLPMALSYRFRWLSAQGLFTWVFPAALLLDQLYEKLHSPRWLGLVVLGICAGAPVVTGIDGRLGLKFGDSTLQALAGKPVVQRIYATSLFHDKLMEELAEAVRSRSKPEEIFFCNVSYLGGMINVLTGRAMTNVMLTEMEERPVEQQVADARVIVWANSDGALRDPQLKRLIERYGLIPAGETELAYLFVNPRPQGKKQRPGAVVPGWLACGLLGLGLGAVVWDLKRS